MKKVHGIEHHENLTIRFARIHRSFVSNESFPSMSNALTLAENAEFGKHVIASRDINIGEMLMAASAFASVEYVSCIGQCCFECGKTGNENIRCDHCINVWFCSERCSLSQTHREKCNTMFSKDDCKMVRLVTEIIRVAVDAVVDLKPFMEFAHGILNDTQESNPPSRKYRPPYSLYAEMLQLKAKPEEHHRRIADCALKYVKQLPKLKSQNDHFGRLLFHMAYRHTTTLSLNTFSEQEAISKGALLHRYSIFDALSRLNHSCHPNLSSWIDDDDITYCTAARAIKKGEQVFITYLGDIE